MGAGDRRGVGGAMRQPIILSGTGRSQGIQGRQRGKKIEGAMSHSDAFLDESVSLSSFSLNVFPKGMFRVETIVRTVFAAI